MPSYRKNAQEIRPRKETVFSEKKDRPVIRTVLLKYCMRPASDSCRRQERKPVYSDRTASTSISSLLIGLSILIARWIGT